ncbi:MAG: tRNA guanosine(34) transglycosylase Tgt [Dehalococcoidia bacterium]|nr:tRNA guanosine(34) transglycosylase Tgt [Dehalococcoidia bacterium]
MPVSHRSSPLSFAVTATDGAARAGTLTTPHGAVSTPAFMPVATQGSVKALTPQEARELGATILLANAYHLALRPGVDVVWRLGGLHRFMGWDGPILTDSGGYQAYSLGDLRRITDAGVEFTSHLDGSRMLLTPETAMEQQAALGADIAMCLDECAPHGLDESATRAAMERTHRWAERCLAAYREAMARPAPPPTSLPAPPLKGDGRVAQALFGIVQGGRFLNLREESARAIAALGFDGCAVGGVSVGEPKAVFYEVARFTAPLLPADKPRYLMGVGSPEDLVEAVWAGYDLFDCALPTRVARNGGVYTATGRVDITSARFRESAGPLEEGCDCAACATFSAAYVHHLFRARELLAYRLATIHNLRHYQRLMQQMRQAIAEGRLDAYRMAFHTRYVPASEDARLEQRQSHAMRRSRRRKQAGEGEGGAVG